MAAREMVRLLKADEIECRIATVNERGLSLLLFKDARVDQKILDETFTPFGWRRSHQSIDGNLYCTVEIWDTEKKQWIGKQDVGSGSSSYAEKEKGTASDSFKRACFNWGIGRELYTAPFIWIPIERVTIDQRDGRFVVKDRFSVASIGYSEDRVITALTIVNGNGVCIYAMQDKKQKERPTAQEIKKTGDTKVREQRSQSGHSEKAQSDRTVSQQNPEISPGQMAALNRELERTGVPLETVLDRYQLAGMNGMTADIYEKAMGCLRRSKDRAA
ncbi:MAG: hypothetical protein LUE86_08700 [Clostridiales bacterium]|nr:hypothetical protein [Clostridiales bacterium]